MTNQFMFPMHPQTPLQSTPRWQRLARRVLFMLWLALAGLGSTAAQALIIHGVVFEDTAGDLLNDGAVNDANNPGINGLTVRLYSSGGAQVATTSTFTFSGAPGTYVFGSVTPGIYYVAVDAPTRTAGGTTGVLGEQTYAKVGSGNSAPAGDNGYGTLCVMGTPPTYTAQVLTSYSTNTAANPANGSCYGGRSGTQADGGTALTSKDHVTRVIPISSDVAGVNFGFSFNVVTNTKISGQGSVAQFVTNANAINGPNAMRFVPAVAVNQGNYWRLSNATIPALTDHYTTLDGTAHSNASGIAALSTNSVTLGTGNNVGTSNIALGQLNGPELEFYDTRITIGASTALRGSFAVIRDLSLNTSITAVDVAYGNGVEISANVIGSTAYGYGSADNGGGIKIGTSSALPIGPRIKNNLFFLAADATAGVQSSTNTVTNATITGNEFKGTGTAAIVIDGSGGLRGTSVISENLIKGFAGYGILDTTTFAASDSQDLLIQNNTITGSDAILVNVDTTDDTNRYTISQNVLENSTGVGSSGVALGSNAKGIQISQNQFGGNGRNAIDLNNNGVSINTGSCTAASTGGANGNAARPSITAAAVSGSTLTVSGTFCNTAGNIYTLEFYKAAASGTANGTANDDYGTDSLPAGEGVAYLGSLTGLTGGTFNGKALTITAGALLSSDSVTAIAICTSGSCTLGSTSEFSVNMPLEMIHGVVFEDTAGDLLNGGTVNDVYNPGINGLTVRLFNSAGVQQATSTTATVAGVDGSYSFGGYSAGKYYVAVDAPTRTADSTTGVLGQQTYAKVGSGNSGLAGGAGYGTLCVMGAPPTYTAQVLASYSTNTAANPANGSCYGGRSGAAADSGFALTSKLHVTRVVLGSTLVSNVDFGFSFNVVTNTRTTGPGSVAQFVTNANAIALGNVMRFVPAVAADMGTYWSLSGATIPPLTDKSTTLDGTAYSNTDGVTVYNPNNETLGTGNTVGAVPIALNTLNGPELELFETPITIGTGTSTTLSGSYAKIKNLALNTSTTAIDVAYGTNVTISNNVIGATANDYSLVSNGGGIKIGTSSALSTGPTIENNLFFLNVAATAGVQSIDNTVTNAKIIGNEFKGVSTAAIHIHSSGGLRGSSVIRDNLINGFAGLGIRDITTSAASDSQGLTIQNNTITGVTSAAIVVSVDTTGDTKRYTISQNVLKNNTGVGSSGVVLGSNAKGIQISQNQFGGNRSNAIDLTGNRVSINTDSCTAAGTTGANGNAARPSITAAVLSGSTLTVSGTFCNTAGNTYTLEFYKAAASGTATGTANNDYGTDSLPAGEGEVYLGSLTALTGGTFNGKALTITAGALLSSDSVTAIAICTSGSCTLGSTSEFSVNFLIEMIQGVVFQDTVGDLLADGVVNGADNNNPGINGLTVRLFDSAGVQQATSTTDTVAGVAGSYSFGGYSAGTYYVAVDAPTRTAGGTTGVLGQQTYASAGAGNSGAAGGAGYGTLCVTGTPPTYAGQALASYATNTAANPANGSCYSGRNGGLSDSGTALTSKLHVTRVVFGSTPVSNVDFGFSFNVVTTRNATGQGSVVQFVTNANAIDGPNAMRFVPAVVANLGMGTYWSVGSATIPPLTNADTTLDGTAYSNADGSTVYNPNAVTLGTGNTVGTAPIALNTLNGPELQFANTRITIGTGTIATLRGDNATIKNLALNTSGTAIDVAYGNSVTISNNVIGATANNYSLVSNGGGIKIGTGAALTSGPMIENNLFFLNAAATAGVQSSTNTVTNATITGNEFKGASTAAIDIDSSGGLRGTSVIRDNLISGFAGYGIRDGTTSAASDSQRLLIQNNTITGSNGYDAILVNVDTTGDTGLYTITQNVLTGSLGGLGSGVSLGVNAKGIRISQNQFGGNGANAIDLNNGTGVSINTDSCTAASTGGANGNAARPTITSVVQSTATTLLVSGTYCGTGTYTLEFYKASGTGTAGSGDMGSDGQMAGEGVAYLGSLTGLIGGAFNGKALTISGTLVPGDSVTAIAIRTDGTIGSQAGNTSEFSANVVISPRLLLRKTSADGVGTFAFTLTNADADWVAAGNQTTASITTASAGIALSYDANGAEAGVQPIVIIAPGTAVTVAEAVTSGWQLTAASCTDGTSTFTAPGLPITGGAAIAGTVTIPAANVTAGADWTCDFSNLKMSSNVSGHVFKDSGAPSPLGSGANTGTPNDGLQNGQEAGIAGVTVNLTNCAGTTYASTSTDGEGGYSLSVPSTTSGNVCVQQTKPTGDIATGANVGAVGSATVLPMSTATTVAGTVYTYDRNLDSIQFALAAGINYADLNFGDVLANQLMVDGSLTGMPGGNVQFPHTFIAGTGGQVSFSSTASASPAVAGWTEIVYQDVNCDSKLDASDIRLSPPSALLNVVEGQKICLLMNEFVPANAPNGAINTATLTASFVYTNASPALSASYTRQDMSLVSNSALSLVKQVRNVTQATALATSNTAKTGDVLEYQVTYSNNGPSIINTLVLNDTTPAYTRFTSAACGAPLPASLTGCTVSTQPAVGTSGSINWTFTGGLIGGGTGTVLFRVTVQ